MGTGIVKTCARSSHKWTAHGKILSHRTNTAYRSVQCANFCTGSVWLGQLSFNLLVQES